MGELSPAQEDEVLLYAERYPEVRKEIDLIEESVEQLALSAALQPPVGVLDKIHERIATEETNKKEKTEEKKEPKSKKINTLRYGVAATFTLKLVAMAIAAHFWINWKSSESQVERLQNRYHKLEQQTQQLNQALMVVSDPDFQAYVLQSQNGSSSARPIVYWNEKTDQLYLNTGQLAATDSDHQYQLWAIVNEQAKSLGTFDVSTSAFPQIIPLQGQPNISSFVLSLEEEGGSPKPSNEAVHFRSEMK